MCNIKKKILFLKTIILFMHTWIYASKRLDFLKKSSLKCLRKDPFYFIITEIARKLQNSMKNSNIDYICVLYNKWLKSNNNDNIKPTIH